MMATLIYALVLYCQRLSKINDNQIASARRAATTPARKGLHVTHTLPVPDSTIKQAFGKCWASYSISLCRQIARPGILLTIANAPSVLIMSSIAIRHLKLPSGMAIFYYWLWVNMLRFDVYNGGELASNIDLSGAYAFGQDAIPVRAELTVDKGQVFCSKRVPGACGLALLWETRGVGKFMLSTTRLPERSRPYNLNVELARAQMTRLAQKREDWGLFDFQGAEKINHDFQSVRAKFILALQADDPAQAAKLADEALAEGILAGEKMALFHADILFARRKATSPTGITGVFGCGVDLAAMRDDYSDRMREAFDFINVPIHWKLTEPKERQYQYTQIDAWFAWAARNHRPIHAGPLVSFDHSSLPEWLYLWEHDYEALRDLVYEHIQRIVQRYEKQVRTWTVVSGIHANNSFNLNFEQLMELTRMSCLQVKKLAPRCNVMIELAMPWGEYYARNQRTIPPLLYADMAVQAGVKFDCFGLQLYQGVPTDGLYVRDLMQISSMLDEFVGFGKPLHITACQVPSDIAPDTTDAWGGKESSAKAGSWHGPWTQRLQAEWLQAFSRMAISKPFVETICWRDLSDSDAHYVPHGGLCKDAIEPKLAYKELRALRGMLAQSAEKRAK
jgi:hypothetical protein